MLFALLSCSALSSERLDELSGSVQVGNQWKVVAFQKPAVATFYMNELQLVTDGRFDFEGDSGIVDAKERKPLGIEAILVSQGGQDYNLTELASASTENENLIIATAPELRTANSGNAWTKIRIRSKRGFKIKRIDWYTYDPGKVKN
ncbi:MAG TPA: hypothetical protein VJ385_04355 [Fibrobacteria bacterium]|nr:hypothetical protein [Fibrobacteria bacterium]